jgi:N-acetylmannosamine-6-phosphate 2-epimerase / N-acetylmannosamine kinase
MTAALERLRGGLVVSCQPVDGGPMDRPDLIAALARAAVAGGAAGLRIEGVENLRAVRPCVSVPLIGIVKHDLPGCSVRITPHVADAQDLIAAGADIVAYDATPRPRPDSREAVLAAIRQGGAIAMADCATQSDGVAALAGGAAILGTTLSGYTDETATSDPGPDLALVRAFQALGAFTMAEGRYNSPDLAAAARRAGADAVTVGSAITRLEHVTSWFRDAIAAVTQPLNGYAIDLGGTKIAAARIDSGRITARVQMETDRHSGLTGQIDTMADLLAQIGYQPGTPLGVAVAGRITSEGHWHAVNAGTLTAVSGVPLHAALRARFGGSVIAINDAQAATSAEWHLGAGRGSDAFAYLTVSTGVGAGIMLNGQLLHSRNGLAGHAGFLSSRVAGTTPCGSGRIGTVESCASGGAIAQAAATLGHTGLDARAVFGRARAGEAWADALIDRSAQAIATLIADLAAMLGIDRVAIGGSIGLSPDYLARVVQQLLHEPPLFRPDVTPAHLDHDSALFGAVLATARS